MIDQGPLLLTPAQAGERLGVSPRTVYRLIQTRGLPTVSLGKDVRVPAAALEMWVQVQTRMGEPHPGELHDPEPRAYLVGRKAYVAQVCALCGQILDDGRK